MQVQALRRISYNRKRYKQGAKFLIDNEKHITVLVAVKAIKVLPEEMEIKEVRTEKKVKKVKKIKKESFLSHDEEKDLHDNTNAGTSVKRKKYKRKDLIAEEI